MKNQPAAQGIEFATFPVSPSGGKPGREGSPHAGRHAARQHKTLARIMRAAPPTRGAAAPLFIPRRLLGADALYNAKRTFHLLIKPDNLTSYQQTSESQINRANGA